MPSNTSPIMRPCGACYGLVFLRFVVMIGFIVWHCARLAPSSIICGLPCVAVVWVYSIDSGDGKPGRLKLSGGGVPPEGDGKPPQEPQGVA